MCVCVCAHTCTTHAIACIHCTEHVYCTSMACSAVYMSVHTIEANTMYSTQLPAWQYSSVPSVARASGIHVRTCILYNYYFIVLLLLLLFMSVAFTVSLYTKARSISGGGNQVQAAACMFQFNIAIIYV